MRRSIHGVLVATALAMLGLVACSEEGGGASRGGTDSVTTGAGGTGSVATPEGAMRQGS
jgi:hypothetical protein